MLPNLASTMAVWFGQHILLPLSTQLFAFSLSSFTVWWTECGVPCKAFWLHLSLRDRIGLVAWLLFRFVQCARNIAQNMLPPSVDLPWCIYGCVIYVKPVPVYGVSIVAEWLSQIWTIVFFLNTHFCTNRREVWDGTMSSPPSLPCFYTHQPQLKRRVRVTVRSS
jgi:hypothetical protein